MPFKKILSFFLLLFLLTAVKLKAQTVSVTETGKKYHAKNCGLAKTGKKGMALADAKKQGYEPCKQCKADEATETKMPKQSPPKEPGKKASQEKR